MNANGYAASEVTLGDLNEAADAAAAPGEIYLTRFAVNSRAAGPNGGEGRPVSDW